MLLSNRKVAGFSFAIVLVAFVLRGVLMLDPDFGWHVRNGAYFTSYGIPHTDPYTYSMPSFPVISHEWLNDITIFNLLFRILGRKGLVIIFTVFAALAVYVSSEIHLGKSSKKLDNAIRLPIVILCLGSILMFFGVRTQVESWLLYALLLKTLLDHDFQKYAPFLLILFAFWANLHGSFALGVLTIWLVFTARQIANRKLNLKLLTIGVLSTVATFANPYSVRIWDEVLLTVTDQSLRWNISEWRPSFIYFNGFYLLIATLSTTLLVKYRKYFNLEVKVLFIFLLIQSLLSIRHIPLFALMALPVSLRGVALFRQDINHPGSLKRFKMAVGAFSLGVIAVFLPQAYLSTHEALALSEQNFYPSAAIEYLKTNPPKGNLFAEYGWGGYLEWKLPQYKVFIDGRMPSWRRNNPPDGEAGWAFGEYLNVTFKGDGFDQFVEKYVINTVLWTKHDKNQRVSFLESIGLKFAEGFDNKLRSLGWAVVYEDNISIILQM